MSFSATDAAFEGFRIAARRPGAFLAWSLVLALAVSVLLGDVVLMFGPMVLQVLQHPGHTVAPPPDMFERVFVFYPFVLIWGIAVSSLFVCAVYRQLLRPADKGFAYLRLGGDELRMIGLWLLLILMWIVGASTLTAIGVALVFAVQGTEWKIVAGVLYGAAAVALVIFVAVRLSLAAPMTFAERRLRVFASWRLTRGRFWPLLGMWLLAFAASLGVAMLSGAIVEAVAFGAMGLSIRTNTAPDFAAGAPIFVIAAILYLLGAALQLVVKIAPAAAAYRGLVPQAGQADVFS